MDGLTLSVDTVFFFQAEDGIRYVAVTGVQTCALPILQSPISVRTAASASTGVSLKRIGNVDVPVGPSAMAGVGAPPGSAAGLRARHARSRLDRKSVV